MRRTKIVCTMGPNTNSRDLMKKLIETGMDVARFNFSHGDHDEQKMRMDMLKELRKELKTPVAILLDTKGPEIRTGKLKDGKKVTLKEGDLYTLTTEEIVGDETRGYINYAGLAEDVKPGDRILIDDGLIELHVREVNGTDIVCRIENGGELGEIEYENFNAAAATVKVRGLNIHPGSAKNKMKNAALLLAEFIGLLPAAETPAHTEGYEGFFHLCEMSGDESSAEAAYIIRDHNREKFETRKVLMQQTADFMNQKYGAGTFTLHMTDSYYNMKEKLTDHMDLIHNAEAAMQKAGVTPKIVAIRGGTDGARLSYEGLPCPNLSTGGLNFHSIHEFIPIRSLEKMVEVLRNLVTL